MDKKELKRKINREVLKELYRNGNRFKLKCNIEGFIITVSAVKNVMTTNFSDIKYELKGFDFDTNRNRFTYDMKIQTPVRRFNYAFFRRTKKMAW